MRVRLVAAVLLLLACGRQPTDVRPPPPQPEVTADPAITVPTLPPCDPATVTAGNSCCADGTTRPDCSLAAVHIAYWELPCPEPRSATCSSIHTESVVLPAGQLTIVYVTGSFHVMPGQVTVTLDGSSAGMSEAALPGYTVNPPIPPVPVAAGPHELTFRFASTDGEIPFSWGGFIDLYVR